MKSGFSDWNQPAGTSNAPTIAVGVLGGVQVHQAAGLLEGRPEQHDEHEQHEDHAQAIDLVVRERLLLAARTSRARGAPPARRRSSPR